MPIGCDTEIQIDKGANSLDGVDYDHSNLTEKRDALRAAAAIVAPP